MLGRQTRFLFELRARARQIRLPFFALACGQLPRYPAHRIAELLYQVNKFALYGQNTACALVVKVQPRGRMAVYQPHGI